MKFLLSRLIVGLIAALMFTTGLQSVKAQSKLADKERAVLMFDIELDQLRKNELLKAMDIEEQLIEEMNGPPRDEFDLTKVSRIFGAAQMPDKFSAVQEMGPGDDLPFNFFVRIEFNDKKEMEKVLAMIAESARKMEDGDKTYFMPPAGEGPDNMRIYKYDDSTMEIGTKTYVMRADRNVMTSSLMKSWGKLSADQSVRFAFDIDGCRDFIDELTAMAKQNAPGEQAQAITGELLKAVKDISVLSMTMDPGQTDMMTLTSTSKNEAGAKNVDGTLAGLLTLARTGGNGWLQQMPIQDEKAKKMFRDLIGQFKSKQTGNDVSIAIQKPDGFDKIMKDVVLVEVKKAKAIIEKMNRFRQVGLSVHNYYDSYNKFPFGANDNLSWRVSVLPFVEENKLYDQMNIKEGWDSETNKKFAEKMPKPFGAGGKSSDICWIKSDVTKFAEIRDGSSNTIMLLENPNGVPWSQAKDLTPADAIKLVKGLKDGQDLIAVRYDCSTFKLDNKIDEKKLKLMLDPNDGEIIDE